MRIVSLLPAATEWVCIFGARDDLVGRSHVCSHPPSVKALPEVTAPRHPMNEDSAAIDRAVDDATADESSLFTVDLDQLRALRPDLILTQAQCEVCAVSLSQLEEALEGWDYEQPKLLSMEPMTLRQVLEAGLRIGRAVGRSDASMQWMASAERRLQVMREALGLHRHTDVDTLPTVACVEWMEPLMTAGHWMPDVVEMAGGQAVLSGGGEPSRYVDWEALRAADPDVIAVMPCGYGLQETVRDLHYLVDRPGWRDLRAVQAGRVFLFDGSAYFNRPGPRIYRSIELLAAALHPEWPSRDKLHVDEWEMQPLEVATD